MYNSLDITSHRFFSYIRNGDEDNVNNQSFNNIVVDNFHYTNSYSLFYLNNNVMLMCKKVENRFFEVVKVNGYVLVYFPMTVR